MKKSSTGHSVRVSIFFLCLFSLVRTVSADEFHNINGFFGERATGLGGAFTAISDDAAGAYYNPAGLTFADGDSISISASNYVKTSKVFQGALGPGQDYVKKAEGYLPNFIGAVRSISKRFSLGISLVSPTSSTFNQGDQIILPFMLPTLAEARADENLQNSLIMGGPSLSWKIGRKLSLGTSLYFFSDYQLLSRSTTAVFRDGSYFLESIQDERRTRGFLPILGLMYMPFTKLSLGLSVRRVLVTSKKRRVSETTLSTGVFALPIEVSLSTHNGGASQSSQGLIISPAASGRIPETYEIRGGIALFATSKLLFSFDAIYTSAFRSTQNNMIYSPERRRIIFQDSEIEALTRAQTHNYAAGTEIYLTDNVSVKLGFYTNRANSRDISWFQSYLTAFFAQFNSGRLSVGQIGSGDTSIDVSYSVPEAQEPKRDEYVNTQGYSLGLAYTDAESSISLTFTREHGGGNGGLPTQPNTKLVYNSFTVYLVATTIRR